MARIPVNPGEVDWTGDNSAIVLKEREDGPYTCNVSLFRVLYSPQYGPGHAAVVLWDPQHAHPYNGLFTDNPPLALWLRDAFASHFSAFGDNPLLASLPVKPLTSCERSGDARSSYCETVKGPDLDLRLTWSDLKAPYIVEYGPEHSATGAHEMFSLFVPAGAAEITMNGEVASGKPFPKEMYGRHRGTAFLAFSETWLRAGK